ncbi:MAG TPA: hypothetical protein VE673_06640 [Pseudonocardiaceae bacterium]|jgi:hypothetical protein|nr:hypothetical protein [Pseudonocardiaceae bacterium]
MSPSLAAALAHLPQVPRLPKRVRSTLLTVHVAASAGWLGLIGALVVLEVIGLDSSDPALRMGISVAMTAIAFWILVPLVFASLCTGLVLALGTSWGLTRHWWLLAKSGIAAALTATGVALMLPRLPHVLAGEGEPIQLNTLAVRSAALVLLLVATGISVAKPWGKTRLASSPKTQSKAAAPVAVSARPAEPVLAGRVDALDDVRFQQSRSAQLHALRSLHGQRGLRALPEEAGARGCRVLVVGSHTWIDPAPIAETAAAEPARVARTRSQRPSRSTSLVSRVPA